MSVNGSELKQRLFKHNAAGISFAILRDFQLEYAQCNGAVGKDLSLEAAIAPEEAIEDQFIYSTGAFIAANSGNIDPALKKLINYIAIIEGWKDFYR